MIRFNKNNGTIEPFTIILANRNQEHLGEIVNTEAVNFTGNFNSADELSFTVHKTMNGKEERLWDDIFDLRLVYIAELNEYFEINVSFTDQTYLVKTITAKSLCEAELSQTMLYGIEINTDIDIERDDYKVAKFWTNNTDPQSAEYKSTILYRVLEKVPAYSIKHVDYTLIDLQRVIKIDGKSVYDWLVGDCATEFNCLVKFDSTDRTISFYDLYTTCPVCHHRGLFNDVCTHIITEDDLKKYGRNGKMPNGKGLGETCENTNLGYYGDDTTILVSTENLTDEIKYDTAIDQVKNSFRLEAGDDDMTAAVVNINPNGSQYIYNYSPESLKDMPPALVEAIQEYNVLYNKYRVTEPSNIPNIAPYNNLVTKYKDAYYAAHNNEETLEPIPSPIRGYASLMQCIYQAMDFYSYLESSMMPTLDFPTPTAQSEAQKITNGMGSYIALATYSSRTTQETVESALVNYAKALVYTGFVNVTVETTSCTIGSQTGSWTGRFVVKHNSLEDTDVNKTAYAPSSGTMTLTINDDYDTYIIQKIRKKIAKDEQEGLDLHTLLMEDNLETFKTEIKKYSLNRLRSFKDSIDAVLGVLQEAGIALDPQQQKDSIKLELYTEYYLPFLRKYQACEQEHDLRASELHTIAEYQDNQMVRGTLYSLLERKEEINDILDFKKFLDNASDEYNTTGVPTKIATPIMISNTSPSGYTISASSYHSSYYQPFYAFNREHGDDRYTWATTQSLPQWIQVQFPEAVCIRKVVTFHRNEQNIRAVSNFTFQGSNNGTTWTDLKECEITEKTAHYEASFDIDNRSKFKYYRLYITGNFDNTTGNGCGFADIELYKPDEDYTVDFYTLLTTYTRQDTYNNANYISTSLNNADLFLMAQMFYDAASEELAKSSIYQHSITANLYNLLAMDEFNPLQDHFELGNWLRMSTDDKIYRLRLISYSVNFDDPTHLDTQFSDVTQTGDGYNDLASLLNQAGSMSTSFPSVERQAELGKLAKNGMDDWLKVGLDSTKTRIMNNDSEEIEITNVGITAKTYDDITDTYDDHQLRITHNVLAFTEDNWETVSTALGLFTFTYFEPHVSDRHEVVKREEAYGLVAQAVLAGWVVGTTVEGSTFVGGHIQNPTNSTYISLTDEAWTDYNHPAYPYFIDANGNFQVTRDGNVKIKGGHISNPDDTSYIDLYPYDPNPDGSTRYYPFFLSVKNTFSVMKEDGTILSRGGHFQNFGDTSYIDLGEIGWRKRYDNEGHQIESIYEEYFLRCQTPETFSVTKNGYLISTSGQIGGFYIGSDYISSSTTLSSTSAVTLSTNTFSRQFSIPVPKYNPDTGTLDHYDIESTTFTDLKFALGSYFGVTASGNIYCNNLFANSLVAFNLACEDLNVTGDLSVGGSITGGDTLKITNESDLDGVHIESNRIRATRENILLSNTLYLQNDFKLVGDSPNINAIPYRKIGNNWYELYAVQFGYADPPSDLPEGVLYLKIE